MANFIKTAHDTDTLIPTNMNIEEGQTFKLNDIEFYRCLSIETDNQDTIFHVYRLWFVYGYHPPV